MTHWIGEAKPGGDGLNHPRGVLCVPRGGLPMQFLVVFKGWVFQKSYRKDAEQVSPKGRHYLERGGQVVEWKSVGDSGRVNNVEKCR